MSDLPDKTLEINKKTYDDLIDFIEHNPVTEDKKLAGTTAYYIHGKDHGNVYIRTQARTSKAIYIDIVGNDKEIISLTGVQPREWPELTKLLETRAEQTKLENTVRKFLQEQRIK